mgnify:CR=1 FL=1
MALHLHLLQFYTYTYIYLYLYRLLLTTTSILLLPLRLFHADYSQPSTSYQLLPTDYFLPTTVLYTDYFLPTASYRLLPTDYSLSDYFQPTAIRYGISSTASSLSIKLVPIKNGCCIQVLWWFGFHSYGSFNIKNFWKILLSSLPHKVYV